MLTIIFTSNKKRLCVHVLLAVCILLGLTSCGGRDLSTPSSRLVGHWINENESHHYFAPIDPKTNTGIFIEHMDGEAAYFNYQVLNESLDGENILLQTISDEYPQYPEFKLTKDGSIKDGYGGVFVYVDDKTRP